MITIVLQEFKTPGNCGAVARVAKNFNCDKLVFIKPLCDILSKESLDRATHAKDLLENAKIVNSFEDIKDNYNLLIGTTAQIGSDSNLKRAPLLPKQLNEFITENTALIIGREGDGLTNEEAEMCDLICTIPTSRQYPTMNVSHALSILLYELNKEENILSDSPSREDKEAFLNEINKTINDLDIEETKKDSMKLLWKNFLGKTKITRRELFGLFDFIKKQ